MPSEPLAAAVRWINERIANDSQIGPDLFTQLHAAQLERGLRHGDRTIGSFLRPFVLPRSTYQAIAHAAETLAAAFEQLVERALSDESLLAELALTEREARLARIDPGYTRLCVSSRLDAYLSKGSFKFLEYNAESPAGIVDQMLLEDIFFELPYMREFIARYPFWRPRPHQRLLGALVDAYRQSGGAKDRPQIAIIDWEGVSTESEFYVLKDYFESEGYPTVIADPCHLEYNHGVLTARGLTVDILYKRVLIHELLDKVDDGHPLLRAYAERKVCVANSFRTKVAHKKMSFAILSDPRYESLFTPEQVTVIQHHVPWTRRVREGETTFGGAVFEMTDLLRRERERLVLKPNDDYGGQGVVIGHVTEPHTWEEACELALTRPFVVQELVPVQKETMPKFTDRLAWEEMTIDFDPFLFLNKVEGGIVRLSSSALSNVSSGGGVTALLVLEDA
ncbi:MAG: hypothetical protein H0W76_18970 [Pyrinomonadaceae bacterium]|nr:hypothetical protein [Pyrinomonadaceae bacterium]